MCCSVHVYLGQKGNLYQNDDCIKLQDVNCHLYSKACSICLAADPEKKLAGTSGSIWPSSHSKSESVSCLLSAISVSIFD